MKRYGIPYVGSKQRLAENIVSCFPNGENFLDAMCGGGAVLHCVAESGKFKHLTGMEKDLQMSAVLSWVMSGKLAMEPDRSDYLKWVSFDEFHKIKSNVDAIDGIRTILYSYATNRWDYLYSHDKEPLMKLAHACITENDTDARITALRSLCPYIEDGAANQACRFDVVNRFRRICEVSDRMKRAGDKVDLSIKTGSAFEVPVEFYDGFDCIYFDPPYKATRKYRNQPFDCDAFDRLLERLAEAGKTVFVSELREPCKGYSVVGRWKLNHSTNRDSPHMVEELLWKSQGSDASR